MRLQADSLMQKSTLCGKVLESEIQVAKVGEFISMGLCLIVDTDVNAIKGEE